MKIYIYFPGEDVHMDGNPYVYTLVDAIVANHSDVNIACNEDIFWSNKVIDYDVIHIMWPDSLVLWGKVRHTIEELETQLQMIKTHRIPLVCTCHNLQTHYKKYKEGIIAYDLVYQNADVFIHLEEYSKQLLSVKYPLARHLIIPHHVYDTVYTTIPTKEEALKKLNFKDNQYAISLGAFRNKEERKLFYKIADEFRKYNIYCIAPAIQIEIPQKTLTLRWIKQCVKKALLRIIHPNVIINIGYIPNDLIPYYYALSDISIIQRLEILNSGNVPLGMYFGKVVLGPNVGNVNEIMLKTGNPTFDVHDLSSIRKACAETVRLTKVNKGQQNRKYALRNWLTEDVAEKTYNLYMSGNLYFPQPQLNE